MTGTLTTIRTSTPTATGPVLWSINVRPSVGNNKTGPPRTVPAFMPADEAYYWSFAWQEDVRESMAALAAGDYEDFDSDDPNDIARWLLTVEDDEE